MGLVRYGIDWGNQHPGIVELSMYLRNQGNPELAYQHLSRAYLELWPNMRSTFFSWQAEVFRQYTAAGDKRKWILSLSGGSGTTKSFTTAVIALLEWLADPYNTKILVASTTMSDLRDRIWGYLEDFYNTLPFEIGRLVQHPAPRITIPKSNGGGIFAIPVKSSKEANNLIGRHPKRLCIFIDEGTEFDSSILGNMPNWTAAGKIFKLIVTGNAKSRNDLHGVVSEPVDGWDSVNQDLMTGWPTKDGYCCLFDHMKSPVWRKPELSPRLPFLKTKVEIQDEQERYGEDNPIFLRFTRSHWTELGQQHTVLDRRMISYCNERGGPPQWNGQSKIRIAALDPAWTSGGDDCVFRIADLGQTTDGRWMIDFLGETGVVILKINDTAQMTSFYQIAGQVIEQCGIHGITPENFAMDATGGGVGISEILEHEWASGFLKIVSSESASDFNIGLPHGKTSKDLYDNRVTEMWFNFRNFAMNKQLLNLDRMASDEFTNRQWGYKTRKIAIEPKKEYKSRVGNPFMPGGSPDRSDTATYIVELAVSRFDLRLDGRRQINKPPPENLDRHQEALNRHFFAVEQARIREEAEQARKRSLDWGFGWTRNRHQAR